MNLKNELLNILEERKKNPHPPATQEILNKISLKKTTLGRELEVGDYVLYCMIFYPLGSEGQKNSSVKDTAIITIFTFVPQEIDYITENYIIHPALEDSKPIIIVKKEN